MSDDLELCEWGLPTTAVNYGKVTDCLGLPGHDGPHLVGMAGNGWARIFTVDEQAQTMSEIVHARMERGAAASREEMAALHAVLEITRAKRP